MADEFYVDGIVAERTFPDGETLYLIKWEDYAYTYNTWEPEHHIQPETLTDWREEQSRIDRGESREYDVDAWEIAVARAQRKAEAKARAARLKKLVESRARNLDDDDLDEFVVPDDEPQSGSDDEFLSFYKPRKRRLAANDEDNDVEPTPASAKRRAPDVEQDLDFMDVDDAPVQASGSAAAPQALMSPPVNAAVDMQLDAPPATMPASTLSAAAKRDTTIGPSSGEAGAISVADAIRQLRPARKAVKGVGPARVAKAKPANIFIDWNAPVHKKNRKSVPKPFKNARHAWNTEKRGRVEPEPDIGALELVIPKDGSIIKPGRRESEPEPNPSGLRLEANALDEGDSLFLSQSPPDLAGSFLRRLSHPETNAGSRMRMQEAQEESNFHREFIPQTDVRESNDPMRRSTNVTSPIGTRLEQHEATSPVSPNQPRPRRDVTAWGPQTRNFSNIAKDIDSSARKLYGTLVVGATDPWALRTIFQGIPPPWWGIFLRIKPSPTSKDCFIRITHLCTAPGYVRDYHYGGQGYYAAGWIPHWPETVLLAKVKASLSILRDPAKQYGGLFFSEHYTLLVYAPGSPSWDFIDKLFPADSSPCALRFVMRAPVPAKKPEITTEDAFLPYQPPVISERAVPAPTPPSRNTVGLSLLELPREISRMAGSPDFDSKFREALGFDWQVLLPPSLPKGELPALFLHYDTNQKEAQEELMFMRGLFQDTFHMRVYASDRPGEWALFCDPANIKCGVILFHTSISHYESIPDLAKVLKSGPYHCWRIELRLGQRSLLQKIFPSGGAILIPDSLVLRKPEMAVRILRWYRKVKVPYSHASKWSLVMRPRFRKWIHAILANEGSYKRQPDELAPYKEILAQLMLAFPLGTTYDPETDLERPSPDAALVDPGHLEFYDESIGPETQGLQASQGNDDLLVKWFGKWSVKHLDKHRKFHVVFDGYGENFETDQKFGNMWARAMRHVNVQKSKDFAKEVMERDEARFEERPKKGDDKDN